MRQIDLNEQKQVLLNILVKIDEYCKINNIRYSLGGGTLLGAIRHKGFIPWDDDVDIMMPRPDYLKFIHGFKSFAHDLSIEAFDFNTNWRFPYAKIFNNKTILIEPRSKKNIGIFVDVFPIDGYPAEIEERKRFVRLSSFLMNYLYRKRALYSNNVLKSILVNFSNIFVSASLLNKLIQKIITKYPFETSLYVGAVCGRYAEKECYECSVFKSYTETIFEGHYFQIISDYDIYLNQHYGDYMKLPPVSKQIPSHTNAVYWID